LGHPTANDEASQANGTRATPGKETTTCVGAGSKEGEGGAGAQAHRVEGLIWSRFVKEDGKEKREEEYDHSDLYKHIA
jgi:hypothetical protein